LIILARNSYLREATYEQLMLAMSSKKEEKLDKELYLQAVLAEYKALKDQISKGAEIYPVILSVWIGGVAALFGFSGTIGSPVTLLVIPIFTSLCSLVFVCAIYNNGFIGLYIKKEIERKKLCEIFPAAHLPFAWEGYTERHRRLWGILAVGLLVLVLFLCYGCLGIVSYVYWSEVATSAFLLLTFVLGCLLTTFLPIVVLLFERKMRSLERCD